MFSFVNLFTTKRFYLLLFLSKRATTLVRICTETWCKLINLHHILAADQLNDRSRNTERERGKENGSLNLRRSSNLLSLSMVFCIPNPRMRLWHSFGCCSFARRAALSASNLEAAQTEKVTRWSNYINKLTTETEGLNIRQSKIQVSRWSVQLS